VGDAVRQFHLSTTQYNKATLVAVIAGIPEVVKSEDIYLLKKQKEFWLELFANR
jgi:hypothetical protein